MSKNSTDSRLEPLVGLTAAKALVRVLATSESPVHAAMFYGPRGAGKSQLASAVAEAWLCTANDGTGACGTCQSCVAFGRQRCADFLQVSPQPPSNLIRVSAIRPTDQPDGDEPSVEEFLRTRPLAAQAKVVWIEDADRLNVNAANSLLKILEEPPPYGKFVLTTAWVSRLPLTIVSRTVAVACELPTKPELDGLGAADEDLALMAEGSPGLVAEMTEHRDAFQAIREFARALPQRRPAEGLVASEEFRSICDNLCEARGWTARAGQSRSLEVLARCTAFDRPGWVPAIVEGHRRIVGNGYAPVVFDALFCGLLVVP